MVSAVLIALSKVVYFPMVLLISIIPGYKFDEDITKGRIKKFIVCLIPFLIGMIWCLIAGSYLGNSHPGANAKEQILFVLSNPIRYMWIIIKSIFKNIPYFIVGIVQVFIIIMQMKLLMKLFLALLSLIYIINFIYILWCGRDGSKSIDKRSRITIAGIFVMEIMLIFSAEYVQWTEVGAMEVHGVQGRYFIPVLMLAASLLNYKKGQKTKQIKSSSKYIMNIHFNERLSIGIILAVNCIFLLSAIVLWSSV